MNWKYLECDHFALDGGRGGELNLDAEPNAIFQIAIIGLQRCVTQDLYVQFTFKLSCTVDQ